MDTMKAVRLERTGEPLVMQEIPIPQPGPLDALVRIKAAGICHSDVHMWAGQHPVAFSPITLGHEIAGIVEEVGDMVDPSWIGKRVSLHYVVGCGHCYYCRNGREPLCINANFLAATLDGGFAEFISIPALNLVPLPDSIPFEHGAVLMCSAATSLHALSRGNLHPGESVAVFGSGGVGMTAIQLSRAFGAAKVFAIDINEDKLEIAAQYGAIAIDASQTDAAERIRGMTDGQGVHLALGVVGLAESMEQAVESVRSGGRVVLVGMADQTMRLNPMEQVVVKEVEILGSVDHTYNELPRVIDLAEQGALDMSSVVQRTIRLDADQINQTFGAIDGFAAAVRTVIIPE